MVDEFLGIEESVSKSSLTVREDNIFVDDATLSECGLIEHIAQSAAARVGHIFNTLNRPIPIGYIGSVNDFAIAAHPKVGDTIYTTIEVIQEVFNITLIRAVCRVNDVEIATCKMKIFLDTDEAKS
jgi:predicted hotdog family 3-hydroxylacyl-ACP dehydratase